jgi:hypothetical protein
MLLLSILFALSRHLKISEPIPTHLGAAAERELLERSAAFERFGPKHATFDNMNEAMPRPLQESATSKAAAAAAATKDPGRRQPSMRLPGSTSPVLVGDLTHYNNLVAAPAESSATMAEALAKRQQRFVQAHSISSVDGMGKARPLGGVPLFMVTGNGCGCRWVDLPGRGGCSRSGGQALADRRATAGGAGVREKPTAAGTERRCGVTATRSLAQRQQREAAFVVSPPAAAIANPPGGRGPGCRTSPGLHGAKRPGARFPNPGCK